MAAPTELDFALASFWEFARIWRSGRKCKLELHCDEGQCEVRLVAGLGAAEEPHFPSNFQADNFKRKKTPSQLRREQRRRLERRNPHVEVAVKAAEAPLAEKQEDVNNDAEEENHSETKVADILAAVTIDDQGEAAQATQHAQHPDQPTAAQAVVHFPSHVSHHDVPAAQPQQHSPIPQLDGHQEHVWSCQCCRYETFFNTEDELQLHHYYEHGDFLTYEECSLCSPWRHVWT